MAATDETGWDAPAKVAALRAEGASGGLAHIFTSDDACLQRFLRARRGDVPKALDMLLEHQKWRRAETPWWPHACCPLQHIAADWRSKKAYVSPAPCPEGSVVAFVQAALHDKNEERLNLKRFIVSRRAAQRALAAGRAPPPPTHARPPSLLSHAVLSERRGVRAPGRVQRSAQAQPDDHHSVLYWLWLQRWL